MTKLKVYNCAWFFILTSLLCNTTLQAQEQIGFEASVSFIKSKMKENHIPGLAACVVKESQLYWYSAYGWANVEKRIPMSIDALMNIGSISKTITATAIMQLWERGLVKLDVNINQYLPFDVQNPNFPGIPINIKQLLTHTSSIRDGEAYNQGYSCGDPNVSLRDWIIGYLAPGGKYFNEKENFLTKAPGQQRKYSNVGFGLLGLIVEEVAQVPFSQYCKKYIFTPLEMNETGWYLSEINRADHVTPYLYITRENRKGIKTYFGHLTTGEFKINSNLATCSYGFPNYPDGLLRTSVRELSHFLVAIINQGKFKDTQILEAATVKKMLTAQVDGESKQGLCWRKKEFESLWGHGGSDPGITTQMYFNPESKLGVIVFQNSNQGDLFKIVEKIYHPAKNPG